MRIDNRNPKNVLALTALRLRAPGGMRGSTSLSGGGGSPDEVGLEESWQRIDEARRADAADRDRQIRSLAQASRAGSYRVEAREVGRAIVEETIAISASATGG